MKGTYDPLLVMLSIAVAVFASYVALDLASRVTASTGRLARAWLAGGALSMGMGIWSMHFIGMLAFQLPMPMSYSLSITALSLLIAVVVSAFALHTVSRDSPGLRHLVGGGVLMGIGIASMHYVGMAAMHMSSPVRYDPTLFALSIGVAIVASWAALWIALRLRTETLLTGFWRKAGGALLMGAAICGMHYTGMAAAIFPPHSMPMASSPAIPSFGVAVTIGAFTFMMLATTIFVSIADTLHTRQDSLHKQRAKARQARHDELEQRVSVRTTELANANAALQAVVARHQNAVRALEVSKDEARTIIDTAHDAYIAMDAESVVLEWNQQAERTFGWKRSEAVGRNLTELIIPARHRPAHLHGIAHFLTTGEGPVLNQRIELPALHHDGYELPVELTIWATPMGVSYKFNAFLHDIRRQHALRRLAAQTSAAVTLMESASLGDAAPKVLQTVCNALDWNVGLLWMVDPGTDALRCVATWSRSDEPHPGLIDASRTRTVLRGADLPGRVWDEGKAVWIAEVASDTRFSRVRYAIDDGFHSAFALPLFSGKEVLGVAEFFSPRIERPDPELMEMMETLGSLLGQFMARKRVEEALENKSEFLGTLLDNLTEGIVACDADSRLTLINRATREMHGQSGQSLPPEEWVDHYELFHIDGQTPLKTEEIPLVRALRGERIRNLEIVIVPVDGRPLTLACNGQALVNASGRTLGAVVAMHDVTERKEAEQRLQRLAHFDTLTGLPNRGLFYESLQSALAQAEERGWIVAVLFIDLDHFKTINDTLGHGIGDDLLLQVGNRLVKALRIRDVAGRLGGDEFGVILMAPDDPQIAAVLAGKIQQAFSEPFLLGGREVLVTASIGITVYPHDATDVDALMKYADTAMYEAKDAGRDSYRFYTAEMNTRALERLDLESALRKALERDEFVLHYQPKLDITSGRWTGVEALLRWNRPGHGLVAPEQFIPALEETGLIVSVGAWVIKTACRQIARWQDAGMALSIAVNVSPQQFLRVAPDRNGGVGLPIADSLMESAAHCMRAHCVSPGSLEFELTESTLMRHAEKTVDLLKQLKSIGVGISIDDFGTGYSSLAYLKRFPIDTLKIDGHFIRDLTGNPDDEAIVLAIIGMAHSLKLTVVAECVETREQLDFLRRHGCHQAQGYFVARPMPPDDLVRAWLELESRRTEPA